MADARSSLHFNGSVFCVPGLQCVLWCLHYLQATAETVKAENAKVSMLLLSLGW